MICKKKLYLRFIEILCFLNFSGKIKEQCQLVNLVSPSPSASTKYHPPSTSTFLYYLTFVVLATNSIFSRNTRYIIVSLAHVYTDTLSILISPWHSWNIALLTLNNNHSLTLLHSTFSYTRHCMTFKTTVGSYCQRRCYFIFCSQRRYLHFSSSI
jgi:hypothetical protein